MENDLLEEVRAGLKGRSLAELANLAERLKDKRISFWLLYRLSRGNYPSNPTYFRVAAIANELRKETA